MSDKIPAPDLQEFREALAGLPEVRDLGEEEAPADLLGLVAGFSTLLRKVGVQQTRTATDLLAAVKEATARVDEVHTAALDERDRAVQAERQAERLADVIIQHLDALDRAIALMTKAEGLGAWVSALGDVVTETLADGRSAGLVATGLPGERFNPDLHDIEDGQKLSEAEEKITRTSARGYLLNGRLLRRARVEITHSED